MSKKLGDTTVDPSDDLLYSYPLPKPTTLDEILDQFTQPTGKEVYLKDLKAQIKSLFLSVVGADEAVDKPYEEGGADIAYKRNQLRAELRRAIESL